MRLRVTRMNASLHYERDKEGVPTVHLCLLVTAPEGEVPIDLVFDRAEDADQVGKEAQRAALSLANSAQYLPESTKEMTT